ncbi:MAG: FAD:protein FMN transferase [Candidatus Cloacimonetes bacterium]|nr:FAD:protein FMN transferase [Candidatus Cloacimonadota bacterium]
MKRRDIVNIAILLAVIFIAIYRYKVQYNTETRSRFMMDTLVELSFTARQKNIPAIMDSTIALMNHYERKFSYYDEEGDLWRINNYRHEKVEIDPEFYELLTLAEIFYQKTDGRYDVSIGVLTEIWNSERTYPPPADSIRMAMDKVGFSDIIIRPNYIIRPVGMKINLGSIAKGYIIDKAVEYAISKGIHSGYINAGGDIRLFGDQGREQLIGIQHPRDVNDVIAVLAIKDRAVVTSGDYERYFDHEGRRYHHIIDALTGYPVDNIFSVTVLAPNTTLADVLSTAIFLLTPEEGINLIKSYSDTECVIYYHDGEEIVSLRSEGIRDLIVTD